MLRRYLLVAATLATVALAVIAAQAGALALALPTTPSAMDLLGAVGRCLFVGVLMAYLAGAWYGRHRDSAGARWLAVGALALSVLAMETVIAPESWLAGLPLELIAAGSVLVLEVHRGVARHDARLAYAEQVAVEAGVVVPRGILRPRSDGPVKRQPQPSPCSFCGSRDVQALVIMPDGAICAKCAWSDWKLNVLATHCALCAVRLERRPGLAHVPSAPGVSGPNRVACVACRDMVRAFFSELPELDDDTIATLEVPLTGRRPGNN